MKLISKYKLTIVGACFGAIAGYAYFYFVGCDSGSCPITSNPANSTLYGACMGALLLTGLKKTKYEQTKNRY